MTKVVTPHFDLPFRFVGSSAAVVEQDSLADQANCIRAILSYDLGSRPDNPDFGVSDQVFTHSAGGAEELAAAIKLWEPRADLSVDIHPDLLDDMVKDINIEVRGVQVD